MSADEPDLLDMIEEAEKGPLPCRHFGKTAFTLDTDIDSPYFMEWVDSNPRCRRSRVPGRKQHAPQVEALARRLNQRRRDRRGSLATWTVLERLST